MAFYNALIVCLDRIVRLASTIRPELYFPALVLIMGLLGASVCHGATISNLTDNPYSFTLQAADEQKITVDVEQGKTQLVPGFIPQENKPLNVIYHIQNSWAQTFFKPFKFLTTWGIGTSLVNESETRELKAAAFKPDKTISSNFKLVLSKGSAGEVKLFFIDGEMLDKAAIVQAVKELTSRKALKVSSRRSFGRARA